MYQNRVYKEDPGEGGERLILAADEEEFTVLQLLAAKVDQ